MSISFLAFFSVSSIFFNHLVVCGNTLDITLRMVGIGINRILDLRSRCSH
jgi:hypothetical protein